MALTLYTFGPHFGLPDPSPFVMKADLLLKMSGLPYATDSRGFRKAPKGKLPYLRDGDALVEVQVPKTVPMQKVTLTLNGADVGATFVADDQAHTFRGVLSGLVNGDNLFVADSNGQGKGRPWASLTITNHPRGGPVALAVVRRAEVRAALHHPAWDRGGLG